MSEPISIQYDSDQGNLSIHLQSSIDVNNVEAVYAALDKSLIEHEKADLIEVDASKVDVIDTCGFQTLMALKQSCCDKEQGFSMINPSSSFTETAHLLGLEQHI